MNYTKLKDMSKQSAWMGDKLFPSIYSCQYRGECSKEARRSAKPLGWVRFPTVPAIFLGVAQLAERVAWDHEAVRAGLTTQTSMGL